MSRRTFPISSTAFRRRLQDLSCHPFMHLGIPVKSGLVVYFLSSGRARYAGASRHAASIHLVSPLAARGRRALQDKFFVLTSPEQWPCPVCWGEPPCRIISSLCGQRKVDEHCRKHDISEAYTARPASDQRVCMPLPEGDVWVTRMRWMPGCASRCTASSAKCSTTSSVRRASSCPTRSSTWLACTRACRRPGCEFVGEVDQEL